MTTSPISLKLHCASWQQLASLHERDLTRGAVFLRTATPPRVGTRVRINVTLPTQTLIVLNGVVERHIGPGELNGRGPGVDIKLQSVPQSALWLIESALEAARRKDATLAASQRRAEGVEGASRPGAPEARAAGEQSRPGTDGLTAASHARAVTGPPPVPAAAGPAEDVARAYALLDAGKVLEAMTVLKAAARRDPGDRAARSGVELAAGHMALGAHDRREAAQRFAAALALDPDNERAARDLAEVRRQATDERESLLTRLLKPRE